MKKATIIAILILAMMSSVLAGTLANYTITLDDVASGSVVGKEFIFLEDGTDTFQHGVKIAPTETVTWRFGVKNYDGNVITETDMEYDLTFDVHATSGKSAIDPLIVTVKDEDGDVVDSVTGVGLIHVSGSFPLSEDRQSDAYTVEIYWPSNDAVDIGYAGGNYGTTVDVSAVGTQVASGGGSEGGGGEEEEPPAESDVAVVFDATNTWGGSNNQYDFRVTITNNSDQTLEDWEMECLFFEDISSCWNANMQHENLTTGEHRFKNPRYNNPATDSIAPGASVVFTGQAYGAGTSPMSNVRVNGIEAQITNNFGVQNTWSH